MADGITLNAMSGGDKVRTIDRGTNGETQVMQVDVGGASAEDLLTRGQGAKTASLPVVLASDDDIQAKVGIVTETAPASDTASSGLNGRLQRIAQRLSSLIALVPASLGQKAMSASMAVVIASDQSSVPVSFAGGSIVASGTFTRPADTTAYAIGDLMGNSTTAGSVVPVSLTVARVNGGSGSILRCRVSTTKTGLAGTETFRVRLFTTAPTISSGDNAATSVTGRAAGEFAEFDVVMNQVFNDGAKGSAGPLSGSQAIFVCGGGVQTVQALMEARTAYTPISGEVFVIELEVLQD